MRSQLSLPCRGGRGQNTYGTPPYRVPPSYRGPVSPLPLGVFWGPKGGSIP